MWAGPYRSEVTANIYLESWFTYMYKQERVNKSINGTSVGFNGYLNEREIMRGILQGIMLTIKCPLSLPFKTTVGSSSKATARRLPITSQSGLIRMREVQIDMDIMFVYNNHQDV